jgi:hypothetical protein
MTIDGLMARTVALLGLPSTMAISPTMPPLKRFRKHSCRRELGRLDSRKYFVHAIEIDLSLGGQCQPPGRAIDETHTDALLQSRDELCHGGWRQTYVFGCARKAAAPRHALEKMAISVDELAIPEIPS